jgi:exonuclease 1
MLINGDFAGATRKMIEGAEITSEMIHFFILELRSLKVEFIVAPYEADAQLAYLFQQKRIDVVLTEDSDLLLFGANKCFFKMDM